MILTCGAHPSPRPGAPPPTPARTARNPPPTRQNPPPSATRRHHEHAYTRTPSGPSGPVTKPITDGKPAHDGLPDPSAAVLRSADMCFPQPAGSFRKPNYGCTMQNLPDGSQVKTWVTPRAAGTGASYEAQLVMPDGRRVGRIACSGNPAHAPHAGTPADPHPTRGARPPTRLVHGMTAPPS